MSSCNSLSIFSLFLCYFHVNIALETENLVGGYRAYEANHRYDAAVIGRYNRSSTRYLLCSAGIIGEFFILSASHCFFTKNFPRLKKITFYVVVGSMEITAYEDLKEIDKIFKLGYDHEPFRNDLAMLKLKKGLQLQDSPYLTSMKLPILNYVYQNSATVSGYGFRFYNPMDFHSNITQQRIDTSFVIQLAYAIVTITQNEECRKASSHIDKLIFTCGVIKADMNYQHRGLCTGDGGAPLVNSDGIVIGIASEPNADCDNTQKGTIYARVPFYAPLIEAIMHGASQTPLISAVIFHNHPHKS